MIIWALFDSGNSCYKKVGEKQEHTIFSIGLDREKKNDNIIQLDLSKTDNGIFLTLDKLPLPDLIIASPPCESWSIASAVKGGNACWGFDYKPRQYHELEHTRYNHEKQMINRLNGELCTLNLIRIIKRYKPSYYIIENPLTSKIWDYISNVIGFKIPYENKTYYNNYGFNVKKPTRFKSNLDLHLTYHNIKPMTQLDKVSGYNKRSNIPDKLIEHIFKEVTNDIQKERHRHIHHTT